MTTQNNVKQEALEAMRALFRPGEVRELRIFGESNGFQKIYSGYFDDFEKMAQAVAQYSGKAEGIYYTLNPCKPALLARCANRVKPCKRGEGTTDSDIERRALFFVDGDPVRPAGISATDEEKNLARDKINEVQQYLAAQGWPQPFPADSGNGFHLDYRIDLPNDEPSRDLLKSCLEALAERFNDERVKIDTSVHNAARICKAYGSLAAKGESTPERPHRLSKLFEPNQAPQAVPFAQLAALAQEAHGRANHFAEPAPSQGLTPEKMEEFLTKASIEYRERVAWDGGWKWVLERCWFDANHAAPDSYVAINRLGALVYSCSHNSCQQNKWHGFRESAEQKIGGKFYFIGSAPAPKKERPRLVVWDSDDFLAQDFPPRLTYMAILGHDTPVLTSHSLNQIFAQRGTGKSMLGMSLAGVLSTGGDFLNFTIPSALKVLYVDGELPRTQIQERMRMLHKACPGARIKIIDLESQGVDGISPLGTEQGQAAIERELDGVDVLLLDSIATLGHFDNLEQEAWDYFNAWLIRLRSRGLCVVTLHQAGKSGEQRALSNNDDPLDVQIKLDRSKDDDEGHLKCVLSYTKMRGLREGAQSLDVEFSKGEWTYRFHEDDKLIELEEYLLTHPTASSRKIAEALPHLGSHATVNKLRSKLKSFARRREEKLARERLARQREPSGKETAL